MLCKFLKKINKLFLFIAMNGIIVGIIGIVYEVVIIFEKVLNTTQTTSDLSSEAVLHCLFYACYILFTLIFFNDIGKMMEEE